MQPTRTPGLVHAVELAATATRTSKGTGEPDRECGRVAKEGEEQRGRNEVGGRDGEGGEREGRRAAYQPVNSNSVHTLTRTYLVRLARRRRKRHAPRLPHRRRRP